jgi:hypothetical protein
MFGKRVSASDAVHLLDFRSEEELAQAVDRGEIEASKGDNEDDAFLIADIVVCKLSQAIASLGVDSSKACRYAEAILSSRLVAHDESVLDWVENETQELFCLIADGQLARIFLRNKEDSKEVEVGAVKPVLLPTTMCEINVFRVIRPVIYKASQLLKSE